jgi:hypothetical protein
MMNKKYNNLLATSVVQGLKAKLHSKPAFMTLPRSTSGRRPMTAAICGVLLKQQEGPVPASTTTMTTATASLPSLPISLTNPIPRSSNQLESTSTMVSKTRTSGFDATPLLLKFQEGPTPPKLSTSRWLESLKPNSNDSWEDLKRAFINNFQGSMIRAGTHHYLSQVKPEMNETLMSYTWCFFETRATIANITNKDIICCFQNGLFSKHTYLSHLVLRTKPNV